MNDLKKFGVREKTVKLLKARDGNRCHYCGNELEISLPQEYNPKGTSIDHIVAQSNGGNDELDNLVLACLKCNLYKKTKHYQEVRFAKETDLMLLFLMGGQDE